MTPTVRGSRAAIYIRISKDQQNSALQRDELPAYCASRGWQVIETYEDHMTGGNDRRPQLDRLMADARRRKFDVVICWRFDRLARSTSHLLRALEEFQSMGIDFVSLREAIDTLFWVPLLSWSARSFASESLRASGPPDAAVCVLEGRTSMSMSMRSASCGIRA